MRAATSPVTPLKYVVGIDIAKDTFVACFGHIATSQHLSFGKETTFANTESIKKCGAVLLTRFLI